MGKCWLHRTGNQCWWWTFTNRRSIKFGSMLFLDRGEGRKWRFTRLSYCQRIWFKWWWWWSGGTTSHKFDSHSICTQCWPIIFNQEWCYCWWLATLNRPQIWKMQTKKIWASDYYYQHLQSASDLDEFFSFSIEVFLGFDCNWQSTNRFDYMVCLVWLLLLFDINICCRGRRFVGDRGKDTRSSTG